MSSIRTSRSRRSARAKIAPLLPGHYLLVLRPEILRNLQRSGRILDHKLLLYCFIEDGLEIRPRLLHSILAMRPHQMVHMRLQLKFIDGVQASRTELGD